MNSHSINRMFCIIPPYVFEKMLESKDKAVRDSALTSMMMSSQIRGERIASALMGNLALSASGNGRRTVFDCHNSFSLNGAVLARSEDGPASGDDSANRLFDGLGITRDFLADVLDRNSLDDQGGRLDGYVHYGIDYNNATFDGSVMRFGDGDGDQFTDFTLSLDVIAHELGHGVTQFTSDLVYENQSGALNESFSDVFGSLVKQWSENQTVDQADWIIGKDVWTPGVNGDALRSLKSPGEAYVNHPVFGTDPQPSHFRKYIPLPLSRDNGGVHLYSGIPNKAFYETAMRIGGNAWEVSGQVWYQALRESNKNATFQDFATSTHEEAKTNWGTDVAQSVAEGWKEVGIVIAGASFGTSRGSRRDPSTGNVSLADIMRELGKITDRIDALEKPKTATSRRKS